MRTSSQRLAGLIVFSLAMAAVPGAVTANTPYTYEYHGSTCQLHANSQGVGYVGGYSEEGALVATPADSGGSPKPTGVVVCPAVIASDMTQFQVADVSFSVTLRLSGTTMTYPSNCDMFLVSGNLGHYVTHLPDAGPFPVDRTYLRCFVKHRPEVVALNGFTVQMSYADASE